MKLYLCRHGEALSVDVHPQSPLSEKGVREVRCLANFLAPAGILVSQIYHSGKLRAQETAEILASTIAVGQTVSVMQGLTPADDAHAATSEINYWTDDAMLVSHLPFLSKLTSALLVGKDNFDLVNFSPATMVCLQKENGLWSILWVLRPALLSQNK